MARCLKQKLLKTVYHLAVCNKTSRKRVTFFTLGQRTAKESGNVSTRRSSTPILSLCAECNPGAFGGPGVANPGYV
jgi:hypothetical protein